MQDARWSQLKQSLLDRGWTWRDETLHAPHDTMSFTTSTAFPLKLETFTNLGDELQRADFAALAEQEELVLLLYNEQLQHRLAKRVPLAQPAIVPRPGSNIVPPAAPRICGRIAPTTLPAASAPRWTWEASSR